jgi:hypothetical protein
MKEAQAGFLKPAARCSINEKTESRRERAGIN